MAVLASINNLLLVGTWTTRVTRVRRKISLFRTFVYFVKNEVVSFRHLTVTYKKMCGRIRLFNMTWIVSKFLQYFQIFIDV